MAQKNLLLHLGKDSFGAQDGDGIQLENRSDGSFEYGKIILDGTEPLGIVNFLVQETNGDNLIAEDSIFSFGRTQVQNIGETLLQDNPTDVELITIADMDGIRIVDIIRNSKTSARKSKIVNTITTCSWECSCIICGNRKLR